METKICIDCKKEKNIDDFYKKRINGKLYYERFCKKCSYTRHKDTYKKYRETHKLERKQYLEANKDKINATRKKYIENNREKINATTKIWRDNNKEEIKKKEQEYRKKNIDRIKLLRQKWLIEHNEEYKKYKQNYDRQYRESHQKEIKEYRQNYRKTHKKEYNEYINNRRNNDEVFFWKHKIREFIRESFYRNNFKKQAKTEEILGCDINYLREHLKQTFKNNYGYDWDGIEKVHIDHIKPISLGNTIEEVNNLCHYTNLQLLKPKDNQIKSNKLNWTITKENI